MTLLGAADPPTDGEVQQLARALAEGRPVSDVQFDRLYPPDLRRVSNLHWTEIGVVRQALELLDPKEGDVVLDIGSGAGKFCLVGSLLRPAHFLGIEERPHLVEAATAAAARLGATRASFSAEDALALDWRHFPMLYLFNPFEENVMPLGHRIDAQPQHSRQRHKQSVRAAQQKLARMPRGTKVVLFHGMGAPMPETYELVHQSIVDVGTLELWICRRASRARPSASGAMPTPPQGRKGSRWPPRR